MDLLCAHKFSNINRQIHELRSQHNSLLLTLSDMPAFCTNVIHGKNPPKNNLHAQQIMIAGTEKELVFGITGKNSINVSLKNQH